MGTFVRLYYENNLFRLCLQDADAVYVIIKCLLESKTHTGVFSRRNKELPEDMYCGGAVALQIWSSFVSFNASEPS